MKRPSTVLHVMNTAAGGAALSTLGLMRAMRAQGIAQAAVCHAAGSREDREALLDATDGRTDFTVLYSWNTKFRTPWHERPIKEVKQGLRTGWARWSGRQVARAAARTGADLIHTNTILNPEGGLAARALGLPHVWHLRELLGPGHWFRLPLEGPALARYLERHCSMLVANSESTAAPVRSAAPPSLLTVVPNGIDLAAFAAGPASRAAGPVIAGMVANLASHFKKHMLFIEAAARVDRVLPVEFRIYGADPSGGRDSDAFPYIRDLRARVRALGLVDRVRFMGFEPRPDRIMRDIDILVHPSDLESFGRIVVEAMAASRPVVGVDGGGVGEIVVDGVTGLLAQPDDADGIAARVSALAVDPERRARMGAAGRRRAEQEYDIAAHAARMLDVYAAALERPLGRRDGRHAA